MPLDAEFKENAVYDLHDAIQLHFDSSQFHSRLRKCPSSLIRNWKDENSFDLLHHCILENNVGALVLLLNEGHFKPPYEPSVWPYLHLIACLGHRTFIPIIVQEIKFQNDAFCLNWNVYDKVISAKMKDGSSNIALEERKKKLTPIDIAGIFLHSNCVELLLEYWQFKKVSFHTKSKRQKDSSKSLYLSLACEANSPYALRLMLRDHSDKKEALESALKLISPECVDVVLRDKSPSDVKNAFHGMNLFHVLYSYSSCQSLKQYEAMAEVTSVLIRHGQNVNACYPSRTFPLYSLLNHQPTSVSGDDVSPCLLAILLLLLNAGADPNFNEILVEDKLYHNNERYAAFGRRPYSSAIICLLSASASWNQTSRNNESELNVIENYVYKCIEILLRHKLDLSFVVKFCESLPDSDMSSQVYQTGNSLHLLVSLRPLHAVSYPIIRLILHYGVNADSYGSWKSNNFCHDLKFASNILPFSIWTRHETNPGSSSHELFVLNDKDLKLFSYILKFMSQQSLREAFSEFQEAVDFQRLSVESAEEKTKLESLHLSGNKIYHEIVEAYRRELNLPWSLQQCTSHVIWKSCRFHIGNVFSLPIPSTLRNVIMHFH